MNEVLNIINEKEKNKRTFKDFLLDLFDIIAFFVFIGGIVLFIRFFLFNPYTVVGQSMDPTFSERDFIIVDKVSPKFSQYKRGDIIVFVPPDKDVPYIKRIIGVPGETIKLNDGSVFVCNKSLEGESCEELSESYLSKGTLTKATCNVSEFTVPEGHYFVLGDNRTHSTDSRCCFGLGCYAGSNYFVPQDYVIGRVYIRIFPNFSKF